MKRLFTAALASCLPLAPAWSQDAERAEQHYYPRPADEGEGSRPWLVILPGGGGIDVFGDERFYFDVAEQWNKAGFDALVVHYQAAAPLVPGVDGDDPGPMEAAVVADALAAAERNGWLDLQCPGFVMGFSMGGAGTLTLAANPPPNLVGAIAYYPVVAGQPDGYRAAVPLLILQGDADELTTRERLESFMAQVADHERVRVIHYPDAEHGFDIPSLATPVEYNGGTFRYQEAAAESAKAEAAAFAQSILDANSGSPPCNFRKED